MPQYIGQIEERKILIPKHSARLKNPSTSCQSFTHKYMNVTKSPSKNSILILVLPSFPSVFITLPGGRMVAGCNHKKKRRAQLCAERILPIWGPCSRQDDESPIPASNDAQTANTGALRALRLLVGKREIGKNQYPETSKLSFRKFSGSYWKINRDLVAGRGGIREGTQERTTGYPQHHRIWRWWV